MIILTKEQQQVADASAMIIVEVPTELQMDAFEHIAELYIDSLLKADPDMTQDTVLHNSSNFCRAVIRRVRDIAASGNQTGRA